VQGSHGMPCNIFEEREVQEVEMKVDDVEVARASPDDRTDPSPIAPSRCRAFWPSVARAARQSAGPIAPDGRCRLRSNTQPCTRSRVPSQKMPRWHWHALYAAPNTKTSASIADATRGPAAAGNKGKTRPAAIASRRTSAAIWPVRIARRPPRATSTPC